MKKVLVGLMILNICLIGFGIRQYQKMIDAIPKNINVAYTLNNSVDLVEKCNSDLTPPAIKEAQKSVIGMALHLSGTRNVERSLPLAPTIVARASGFMLRPGIVVGARHEIIDKLYELRRIGIPLFFNKDSLPESTTYQYAFTGIADNKDGVPVVFQLTLLAIAPVGTHRDYMVLQAKNYPDSVKPLSIGKELQRNDLIYNGGYLPLDSQYPSSVLGRYEAATSDILKCNYKGRVTKVIKNMPINFVGAKTFYETNLEVESGYSGGPILNSDGEVVAMTLETIRALSFGVSVREIDDYVKELEQFGKIPKTNP